MNQHSSRQESVSENHKSHALSVNRSLINATITNNPALEDLIELFLDCCQNGKTPDIDDFVGQHKKFEADLRELLPLLIDLEGLGGSPDPKEPLTNATIPFSVNSEEPLEDFPIQASPLSDIQEPEPTLPESDYRLIRKIGSGGMGVVYEAIQISLNRIVAVKLLAPELVTQARQREQFEREAQVIAMLHHPNIVKVYSAGSSNTICYYAMELIEGQGLNGYKFNNLQELAEIGLQAAEALAYAHRCKVMHRDIKPANMLLDTNGQLRVSDFGLACVLQKDEEMIENAGSRSGTVRYMAPERLSDGINSYSTDQYSLGVSLYELATRSLILPQSSPRDLIHRICSEPLPPLQCAEPDLAAIINKSISFRPDDRYESMDKMASDLRRFLNHEPVSAAQTSFRRRLSLWTKRKPAVAALSFVSIFCAAAFLVALIIGFVRTTNALKLAEKNAAVADATLTKVFDHVEKQIPSNSGTELLEELLPYYQGIVQQRDLPAERIAAANNIIGTYALRAGNYELAQTAFEHLSQLRSDAFPLNQLSESLRRQGKMDEANKLSQQIVDRFAESDNPDNRFEAVRALQALASISIINKTAESGSRPDPETSPQTEPSFDFASLEKAFDIIQELLINDPKNLEYRFQYATILASAAHIFRTNRIFGVEPNAIVLLNELAEEYPDRYEYGLALVETMYRKQYYSQRVRPRDQEALSVALDMSDRLLGRFPNTPKIVSSVIAFREQYSAILRKSGYETESRKETERLMGTLEILFHSPEAPNIARESLINLQFQRLELIIKDKRIIEARRLSKEIETELKCYHGSFLDEFKQKWNNLNEILGLSSAKKKSSPSKQGSAGKSNQNPQKQQKPE